MKPRVLLSLTVVAVMLMAIASGLMNSRRLAQVRAMPIGDVDLANTASGDYTGEFRYGGFTYRVKVTVDAHRITQIAVLRNRRTRYAAKAEAVLARVVQYQTLKVDAVSGATTTSKALLKAAENAFRK